jgi:hypothetical protein
MGKKQEESNASINKMLADNQRQRKDNGQSHGGMGSDTNTKGQSHSEARL